jgi:hypothetical protein
MQFKDKLKEVEKHKLFLDWKKKNKESYLAHVFRMLDEANKDMWQFGFYNPDDTITTFILNKEDVKEVPQEQIFHKERKKLPELSLEEIKLSFEEAVGKANELHDKKYKQHPVMKTIMILQKIEDKQVYNITFVTQTFNTLNIRVDAGEGKIVHEKLTSLMDIAKFEKGKGKDTGYIG